MRNYYSNNQLLMSKSRSFEIKIWHNRIRTAAIFTRRNALRIKDIRMWAAVQDVHAGRIRVRTY